MIITLSMLSVADKVGTGFILCLKAGGLILEEYLGLAIVLEFMLLCSNS